MPKERSKFSKVLFYILWKLLTPFTAIITILFILFLVAYVYCIEKDEDEREDELQKMERKGV